MKRADLVRLIEAHGCVKVREGGRHTLFRNLTNGRRSTIPRHREIKDALARKILRDLDIAAD